MKKYTIVLFSVFASLFISAQQVVSSQGDTYTNATGSIDFTIGEVIINTVTNTSNTLTQGFHQTKLSIVGVEIHNPNFKAKIFPNPTADMLNIKTSTFEKVSYTLYDANGKIVMQNTLFNIETSIVISRLPAGMYALILKNETQNLKTFNLIKY